MTGGAITSWPARLFQATQPKVGRHSGFSALSRPAAPEAPQQGPDGDRGLDTGSWAPRQKWMPRRTTADAHLGRLPELRLDNAENPEWRPNLRAAWPESLAGQLVIAPPRHSGRASSREPGIQNRARLWISGFARKGSRPGMTRHTFHSAGLSCGIAVTSPQLSLYIPLFRR